jgi:hypothetical protein
MTRTRIANSIVALAALLPAQAMPAEDAVLKDLTSAISVLGLPCGPVVSASRQGENDHIATCKNGNRYRVFINPQGRVVALKQ